MMPQDSEKDKQEYDEQLAMFQKEFEKLNINMNDLDMLEKDEGLLNSILMEIA